MRKFFYRTLCGAGFVLMSTMASAQYGPPGGPYRPERVDALIDQVHSDLNQGYDHWKLRNGDRERLNKAEGKLRSFAKDWEHGKFDKGDLDDSMGTIQKVLNDNHLSGAPRDALSHDVDQLRHMGEAYDRHEIGNW